MDLAAAGKGPWQQAGGDFIFKGIFFFLGQLTVFFLFQLPNLFFQRLFDHLTRKDFFFLGGADQMPVIGAVHQGVALFAHGFGEAELADVLAGTGREGEIGQGFFQGLCIQGYRFVESIQGEIFKPHSLLCQKIKPQCKRYICGGKPVSVSCSGHNSSNCHIASYWI